MKDNLYIYTETILYTVYHVLTSSLLCCFSWFERVDQFLRSPSFFLGISFTAAIFLQVKRIKLRIIPEAGGDMLCITLGDLDVILYT